MLYVMETVNQAECVHAHMRVCHKISLVRYIIG